MMTDTLALAITESEARSLVERIRSHINDARALVLELYEKEGWKALGYASWRECVIAEFDQSQAYLYRLLNAAQVERNISPIGEKPIAESVLRPLAKLEPEQQREAWAIATQLSKNPTADQVEKVAKTISQAIKDARSDAKQESEARLPDPAEPNPPFDNRWIQWIGALNQILRIEPFDAGAILDQQGQITEEDHALARRFQEAATCMQRIQDFLTEMQLRYPHVFM